MRKCKFFKEESRAFPWLVPYSWEQRPAKELCSIGTGKSNTQDQTDDGEYPFFIRSDIPVRSNKYLYDCEAVITIGDGNIGKVFHYVNGKFDLHQRCYKMTDFKDVTGRYFYYFFATKFYDRAMRMTAKATVDSVRLEMISEMDISYPSSPTEQRKIALFFGDLDCLITLHQRKQFYVFPKSGAFHNENTNAWEQRKLGEIVLPYADPVPTPRNGYWRVGIRSHAKGTFHDYVLPGRELGTAKMHKVKADNLIVNITFAWEHAVAITDDSDAEMLVSHRFPQFSFSRGMLPVFFKYVILQQKA